jgi:hypothetical protein
MGRRAEKRVQRVELRRDFFEAGRNFPVFAAYLTIDEASPGLSALRPGGSLFAQMPNGSKMSEAELDHIAAGIRPSWELDDAPFRPGGLASPELEALLAGNAGNGAAHSHTNGAAAAITAQRVVSLNVEPEDMVTRVDAVPPTHVLEDAPIAPLRIESAPPAPHPVPQQLLAQAVPASAPMPIAPPPAQVVTYADADPFSDTARKPSPSNAQPKRVKPATSSSDFPAIKKSSNKGLYILLGGGAIAALIGVLVYTSSSSGKSDATKVAASPTASQMPGTATTREIPPPPATDDLPVATAQATQTAAPPAAPPATQTADLPAATAPATQTANQASATPPATTPTHVSHSDSSPPATHHSSPPHSNPPASGGSGKGKGGIVRDVPF